MSAPHLMTPLSEYHDIILEEAEAICHGHAAADCAGADRLHIRALLAERAGRNDVALM
jgi:hypothetical protein